MSLDLDKTRLAGACALLGLALTAHAQSLTFGDVQAKGALPLDATRANALASGARVRYTPITGGPFRYWQLHPGGGLTATRVGTSGASFDAPGNWSVRANGALCVTINWAILSTETWCRLIYPVDDVHFIFGRLAQPDTPGAAYYFSR